MVVTQGAQESWELAPALLWEPELVRALGLALARAPAQPSADQS